MESSKIANFDQENDKADSLFANHSLIYKLSVSFEISPRALLADLKYVYEVRFSERIGV